MTFDYALPSHLIALEPSKKRDDAKLLVFDRAKKKVTHSRVSQLPTFLTKEHFLVVNKAKVDRARIRWSYKNRQEELLLLNCIQTESNRSIWECILSGKKVPKNTWQTLENDFAFRLLERFDKSVSRVEINKRQDQVHAWLEDKGLPPLPPYIRKARLKNKLEETNDQDSSRYQTVFAADSGAVAAPTAGLHFTEHLLGALEKQGVELAKIFLKVGWGTFEPLNDHHWQTGRLHEEFVDISKEATHQIKMALKAKKKIVAVGTTTTRALEWWFQKGFSNDGYHGNCDLFLRPPWRSKIISGLLTNFHLPKSSLLVLVGAFIGDDGHLTLKQIYEEAIREEYRFYSYGDCMLVL